MSTNTVIIEGNLGRDAETRAFQSGAKVVSFAIGVTRRYKAADGQDREETSWVDVKAFGYAADSAEGLAKGERVVVAGELRQETWVDKQGANRSRLVVAASTIARVARRQSQQQPPPQSQPYGGYPPKGYVTPEQAMSPKQQSLPYGGYSPAHPVDDADVPMPQTDADTPF